MLHAAWPPLACLTLFVVVVIILILKYGHKCFGVRVTTLPQPWERSGSQYQYHMDVDTSAHAQPDTPLKQPLDPGELIDTRFAEEPRGARYGSRDQMEIIEDIPEYEPGSREAAV